jgi:hypothetical protein
MRVEVQEGDTITVKAFDGSHGWVRKGAAAIEPMPADKLDGMKAMAEFDDALLDYADKGHDVKLVGTAEVNGRTTYELLLALKGGERERRWIDAETFMELKRGWTYSHDGKSTDKSIYFGDYKKVGGQMVNHSLESEHEGKRVKMVVTDVSFDRPIDGALFVAPKK